MINLTKRFLQSFKQGIKKISVSQLYSITIFSLMFLCGLNFFNLGSIYLVLLIAIISVKILICREIIINSTMILISLFSFTYFAFYSINFGFSITMLGKILVAPVLMYEIGINVLKTYKNKHKAFLNTIFAYSLGFATFVVLCFIARIFQFGLFSSARMIVNIWDGKLSSATVAGMSIALIESLVFPILFIKSPNKKWYHIVCIVFYAVAAFVIALSLSNRAQMLVFFVGVAIGGCFFAMTNRKYRKLLFIAILGFSVMIVGVVVAYQAKLFGFDQFVMKIPLLKRIFVESGLLGTTRFDIYLAFLDQFIYYPFGGNHIALPSGEMYCHNVWLDIYYNAGVFPTIFFVILTLTVIKKVTSITILEKNTLTNVSIACVFYTIMLVFMIEPVMQASIQFFLVFFVFIGMVEYFYQQNISSHILKYTRPLPANGQISLVFISNYLSKHQYAFCRELIKTYGSGFKFIATIPYNNKHIGLENSTNEFEKYTIEMFDNKEDAQRVLDEADVIIAGSASSKLVLPQLKKGKIVFKYTERMYKTSNLWAYLMPKAIYRQFRDHHLLSKYRYYYLCASAYMSFDISRFAISEKRCFKWGYFIEETPYEDFEKILSIKNQEKATEILFVNRLIGWKHPEKCIAVAKHLKTKKIPFKMRIVGTGNMEQQIKDDIQKYNLQDDVIMLGAVSNDDVLNLMKRANIVFASSDYGEGWGVCINEAMTAGCAVVASDSHGSVPYLIKNQVNGVIYDLDDERDMLYQVEQLCENRQKTEQLGKNAFDTMKTTWSACNATKRLARVIDSMVKHTPIENDYQEGPMTTASVHAHGWLKKQKVVEVQKESTNSKSTSGGQIRKGAIVSYIAVFINFVAALLYTPWMIKMIGDTNYSIYTLAMSVVGMFAMDLGLSSAISKYLAKYRVENDTKKANQFMGLIYKLFFAIDGIILVILTVIFIFIKQIYGNTYQDADLQRFKVIFAVVGLYTIAAFPTRPINSIFIAHEKFAFQKTVDLINRLIVVALVVVALLLGGDLYAVVLVNIFAGLVSIALRYIYMKRNIDIKPDFTYKDRPLVKEVFKFSIWITIASLALRLVMSVTPTVISYITKDEIQVNVWGVAAIIEGNVFTLSAVLNGLFLSRFTLLKRKNASPEKYTKELISIGRIKLIITAIIIIGFLTLGKGFMIIWMKKDYSIDTYIVASIILIPAIFTHPLKTADTLLVVHDKMKYYAYSAIVAGITSVTCSIILTNFYGVIGSAIGVCIGIFAGEVVMHCYFCQKHLGISIKKFFAGTYFNLALQLITCIVFGVLLEKIVPTTGWIVFSIKGMVFVTFYAAIMWFFGINKSEKDIVDKMCAPVYVPIFRKIRSINQE